MVKSYLEICENKTNSSVIITANIRPKFTNKLFIYLVKIATKVPFEMENNPIKTRIKDFSHLPLLDLIKVALPINIIRLKINTSGDRRNS